MKNNINYIKGDLFTDSDKDAILAHACNCQGVWGAGIANEFKIRFPKEHKQYIKSCEEYSRGNLGDFDLFGRVLCLYTSFGYGKLKDHPNDIIKNTRLALNSLRIFESQVSSINLPKINSGKFGVPWESTEEILREFPEITFNVYEK